MPSSNPLLEDERQHAIRVLNDCVLACNKCATSCLNENEVKMFTQCIKLNWDCADICALTSQYLSRTSPFAPPVAKQCAAVCDACAEECEKHSYMEHCKECAEVCRRCAEECLKLAS